MIKADADIASDTARKHMDEVEACLQLMKEYNLEGRRDKQRWDAIVRRSEFAARERDRYTAELMRQEPSSYGTRSRWCACSWRE